MPTDNTVAPTEDTTSCQCRRLLLSLIYWCEVFIWFLGGKTRRIMTPRQTDKHCPTLSDRRMEYGIS